jgi:hypothetical protein
MVRRPWASGENYSNEMTNVTSTSRLCRLPQPMALRNQDETNGFQRLYLLRKSTCMCLTKII